MFYILSSDIGPVKAQTALSHFNQRIHVATVDNTVIDNALKAKWQDMEDALQFYSAEISNCKALITRDEKDYPANTSLPIISPKEFITSYL